MVDPIRVMLDGTSLLGERTGIGRYTASLVRELAVRDDVDLTVTAFTARGQTALRRAVPPKVRVRGWPVPARWLRRRWLAGHGPTVESLTGRFDVLHATNFVLPPTSAPGVVTVHDLAFLDRPRDLHPADADLPDLVRWSVGRAAVVCTPSRAVADAVVDRLAVPSDRVVVTPLGVDREWFAAAPPGGELRRRLDLQNPYLLFVGTAQPRKGLDLLLDAHRRNPDLPELVLVGPAGWGTGADTTDPRVRRLGFLPDVELRAVVAGATALLLPSRDEGFGLPVLEAMAAGVPVICSNIPALREVAGGQAVLVAPGDVDSLAAAMATVSGGGRDRAGAAARSAHAARYTWTACAQATVRGYALVRG